MGRGARRRSRLLEVPTKKDNGELRNEQTPKEEGTVYEKRVEIVKNKEGSRDTIRVKLTNLSIKEVTGSYVIPV